MSATRPTVPPRSPPRCGRPLRGAALWILAAGLVAGIGCGSKARKRLRTIVVARVNDAIKLDPALVSDVESIDVLEQMFEHLVRYKVDDGAMRIVAGLATSWSKSSDGRRWTFNLRRGVKFHDGTPMNADAVVFSFLRQKNAAKTEAGRRKYFYWQSYFRNIVDVRKVSEYEVAITTDRPFGPLLASLAMFPVSIISPTAFKKDPDGFASNPVGTGPFRFKRWNKLAGRITLEANKAYWGPKPKLDRVIFVRIEDSRTRLRALMSGQVHIARNLEPEKLQLVRLHPDLTTKEVPANNVFYLAMNTRRPPFNDPLVRWAVNHAIRKDPIIGLVYQNTAKKAIGPLPPGMRPFYTKDVTTYEYDVAKAKQLLAQAGYNPKRRPRLYVMKKARAYIPQPVKAARMIARDLKAIGMPVELVDVRFSVMRAAIGLAKHDLALFGWFGDNGDPDNFLYNLLDADNAQLGNPLNIAFYKDYDFHRLVVAARLSTNVEDRVRLYRQAQKIVTKSAPWVPIAHAKAVIALRRDVQNFKVHPSSLLYLHQVSVK